MDFIADDLGLLVKGVGGCASVTSAFAAILLRDWHRSAQAAAISEIPMGLSADADELALQQSFFYILVMMIGGAAVAEIRTIMDSNGRDAWHRLVELYEPKTRKWTLMLLDIALHPDLSGTTSDTILDNLIQWEYIVNRYCGGKHTVER